MPTISKSKALWRTCLASAFRTALACTIVGCITLYGPSSIQSLITFPAFSYVTVILIVVDDATLGDALRGCWLALYATIQSIGPAILSLWVIGPSRLTTGTTALAVALAAFVVALPAESTHLIAKRIALGEIVIVYVVAYVNGVHTEPIMHPLRVAASAAIGVLACVLALLIPFPRLACHEVKQNNKLLVQNTLERLKLLAKAICEDDKADAVVSISRAKSLATSRSELLRNITRYQEGMKWEWLPFLRPHMSPRERLEEVDTTLRGMEMALRNINSFPVRILDKDLQHNLNTLEDHVSLIIKNAKHNVNCGSLTVPEPSTKSATQFLQSLRTIPTTHHDLPIFFFFFCAKLLHKEPWSKSPTSIQEQSVQRNENPSVGKEKWADWAVTLRSPKLIPAVKCSLSLGLALLLGLIYSKENGIWSGLPVALSFVSSREATLAVANVKAQGTVLGSVYGVLGCFVFERFLPIRFLSLLPWFIFTSFLQRSRMYGKAGGISAIIGAVLILGRKNFGPPSEFALARIIETFIGLSCSILVDLIFAPKRASSCAKIELTQSLASLRESIRSLSLVGKYSLKDNQKLRKQVNELRKFVAEADVEPNLWFLPFHSACYNKLLKSLSELTDLLHFGADALKFLEHEFHRNQTSWNEAVIKLERDIENLKEISCSSIRSFEEICKLKSLRFLEKELEKNNVTYDLELGMSPKSKISWVSALSEDDMEKTIDSYLQHSRNAVDVIYAGEEGEWELKSEVVLSLSALGFCLRACMRETREIEEAIKELVQWENPSSEINLHDISCKLHALHK